MSAIPPVPVYVPPLHEMASPFPCGLCGLDGRRGPDNQWSNQFRALYCVGLDTSQPRLSGVNFCRRFVSNVFPPLPHQRYDEGLDFSTYIQLHPHGPPSPQELQTLPNWAWGFHFHDSCWRLLEQASAPAPVDLKLLWRILHSIPYAASLPLWGHNFGGLYLGSRRENRGGDRFVILGGSSGLIIPSACHDPFEIPELKTRLDQHRIKNDGTALTDEKSMPITPTSTGTSDPFSSLPGELREIILTYVDSEDILSFRLSSRAVAATPLSQYFFQSRFWSGRELGFYFDGFLLSPAEKIGIDWRGLYRSSKERIKYNMVGLGERNRLRIWKQTIQPLTQAMHEITKLSALKGKPESDWPQESDENPGGTWKSIESLHYLDPELVGAIQRQSIQVEIELPSSNIEAIHVSFVDFFGTKYISGLAFETENGEDIEIGYIKPGSEEPLLVEACLEGLHAVVDYCGFKAISPYTSKHMETEYLDWAGDKGNLAVQTLRCSGGAVRKLRATFDGFRMQSLHLP